MNPPDIAPIIPGATRRMVDVQTADAGKIALHVSELGDGPPTLMIHGWPQHAGCWRHVAPLLADDLSLICPDLRGFGASDAPGRGYDPATFAADMVALLDALGIERVNVIGHDWGGAAAFELALRHPARVDRMLVLNTIPPWVAPPLGVLKASIRSWYAVALAAAGDRFVRTQPERLAASMRRDVQHTGYFTHADALAYARVLTEPDRALATKLLYRSYVGIASRARRGGDHAGDRLTQPTHFLFATGDLAVSTAYLSGIESHADDLVVELHNGSGHFVCEELPHTVADRARALFLR